MEISFDQAKRRRTLEDRGLDFADAELVFEGEVRTVLDDRYEYGEDRYITAGLLHGRLVVMIWTPRRQTRHVISMRHCHEREERRWRNRTR